jgi:hypothetical protein
MRAELSLLDELAAQMPDELNPAVEITARMLAERKGCTYDAASTFLNRLVAQGQMTRHEVVVNGARAFAYRKK